MGLGASVSNSVEYIWADLVDRHGEPLLLLEHYPASEQMPGDGDTLDQVAVLDGRPVWRRVWPTPPENPDTGCSSDG